MTVTASHVVVPYAEFLARRERRCRVASELRRQDAQAAVDAEAVAVTVAEPLVHGQKYPCPVKNAEA
jgi:hypothetical protein